MSLEFKVACFAESELTAMRVAFICACNELHVDPHDSYGRELVARFIVDRAADDCDTVSDLVRMTVARFSH